MFFKRKTSQPADVVAQALADYYSLETGLTRPWVSHTDDQAEVVLPFCAASTYSALTAYLTQALKNAGHASMPVNISQQVKAAQAAHAPVSNVRNIIAVASGKGGVGKSTSAVNLAYALMQEGARVGILDADIYGPSIPIMLGNPQVSPTSADNKHMEPPEAWGLVANSIGYLVPEEDAAIWRGPMASRTLKQILDETLWPVLDYLIVDLPPGTGDIQLTMAQQIPVSGSVIVTTPQDLALADAQKGISMFSKVNVPVLGLIENMSYYQCSHCGNKDPIFAEHGGETLAERHGLPLLGQLPLNTSIREHADAGTPLVITQPDSHLSATYRDIARAVSMNLALNVPSVEHTANIKGDPISFKPV